MKKLIVFLALGFCRLTAQEPVLGEPPRKPVERQPLTTAATTDPGASWIDTSSRGAVHYYFAHQFNPNTNQPSGWTGAIAGCNAGATSLAFQEAARARFKWFRAMAGVPAGTTFDSVNNQNDQQAALMMSANNQLSHFPPTNWLCYTAAGATAAGQSNLCLGFSLNLDPGCVAGYIFDGGSNNGPVGHRRWILYPQTRVSGTGDVTPATGFPNANALTAFDSNIWAARPETRQLFVAWPPPGYVPYRNVYARWSFSYPNAGFAGASVTMTRNGTPVTLTLETVENGFGENTLVWVPNFVSPYPKPAADEAIVVNVNNVLVGATPQNFTYQVAIFDSDPLPPAAAIGAFRNAAGSIVADRQSVAGLINSGGLFASDPAVSQSFTGQTFATARDNFGSLWANVINSSTNTWGAWTFGGGVTAGVPAIAAATNGTAYIAVRDTFNSYWIVPFVQGVGFGGWTYLAGIFSTDPVIAAAPDGSVYIVGKDAFNSLWSGRFIPGTGFQGWQYGAGIVKGKPALAMGTDGVGYVAVRDNFDALWIARVQGNTWLGWGYGAGIMSTDPQIATTDAGRVSAVIRDTSGGIWFRELLEGTASSWQDWTFTGGVLKDFSAGSIGPALYIGGRDAANGLWWYNSRSSGAAWVIHGSAGDAQGPLAVAPR